MDKIHSYRVTNAVESTSVTEMTRTVRTQRKHAPWRSWITATAENIRRELEKRGAEVIVCPYNTTADELKALTLTA